MPFKDFTSGAVLTAADIDTYLMQQAVVVCTSATRPGSPVEGMFIFETDTDLAYFYTGSAWQLSSAGKIPYASVNRSAAQSLGNSAWDTVVWDTEVSDTRGLHASGAFTVPTGQGGLWTLCPIVAFAANGTGRRGVAYTIDGGSEVEVNSTPPFASSSMFVAGSSDLILTAGQVVRVRAFQDSGAALNITGPGCTFAFKGAV